MPTKSTSKKRGRPRISLDLKQVERLAAICCTDEEIAGVLGMSVDTLTRRKQEPDFAEALKRGKAAGKTSLRRKQMQIAMKGSAAMLIWLGKQYLGQADKVDVDVKDARERARIAVDEYMARTGKTRDEAIEALRPHIPQISELVH